jgi:CheY-like chemotaxis protein
MADAGDVEPLEQEEGRDDGMQAINDNIKGRTSRDVLRAFAESAGAERESSLRRIVFLVEDDMDDRHQAVEELNRSPFVERVYSFESADKLIDYFITHGYYSGNLIGRIVPSLIVMDIHVPGSSGIDILRELKQHPLTEDMKIVILTGDVSERAERQAREYGAETLIRKPLRIKSINDLIRFPKN